MASSAADDGIAMAYLYLLRSSSPVQALVDLHNHSLAQDEYGHKFARTMGYNYIGTGHGHQDKEQTEPRQFSSDVLIVQGGGEVSNGFGSCHMALGFVKPEGGLKAWQMAREDAYASALELFGAAVLNHPYTDRRFSWVLPDYDYNWGVSETGFHGYAGWDHVSGHFGWVEPLWRSITLLELFNGYDGFGRMGGKAEFQTKADLNWHEQLNDYVYRRRRAPLFATAGTDLKTHFETRWDQYVGTMVHAASFDAQSIESATLSGKSVVSGAAHTRLLVSVTDGDGNVYLPGNKVVGRAPVTIHVEAWSPQPLSHLRVEDPSECARKPR